MLDLDIGLEKDTIFYSHNTIIQEVQAKINALKSPKGFFHRPVLIHVNGVTDEVTDSDYFSAIIDMGELLTAPES